MPRATPPDVGAKIKEIRAKEKLTLDQLAKSSGVSKSMLSQIERGRTNPTLGTLWSLTKSLGIDIPELLGGTVEVANSKNSIEKVKAHQIPQIISADGKCTLKILGPIDKVSEIEWYELLISNGGKLESEGHGEGTIEHLTVQEGELSVSCGDRETILLPGDTARYDACLPHIIVNKGKKSAKALMVVLAI